MMDNVLIIDDLTKSFGEIKAVKGISFEVMKGEMFGLVGPDGAGKTTTIRILCGLLSADSGNAKIFDLNLKPGEEKFKRS